MSDDIVERLRDEALQPGPDVDTGREAADEIERLRSAVFDTDCSCLPHAEELPECRCTRCRTLGVFDD